LQVVLEQSVDDLLLGGPDVLAERGLRDAEGVGALLGGAPSWPREVPAQVRHSKHFLLLVRQSVGHRRVSE